MMPCPNCGEFHSADHECVRVNGTAAVIAWACFFAALWLVAIVAVWRLCRG